MNRNEYSGFTKVFGFSFIQSIKSKVNIIVTCVLCVIALFSVPIMGLISGNDKEKETEKSKIENVFVCDETGMGFYDALKGMKDSKYASIQYTEDKRPVDEVKKIEGKNDAYLNISFDARKGFSLYLIYNPDGEVERNMAEAYVWYLQDNFKEIAADAVGISGDKLEYLQKEVDTKVHISGEKEDGEHGFMKDSFALAVIFIIIFIFALAGDNIGTSIATEKSTRVIEYLMVSIRPMALITGKILASMSVFMIQIACTAVSFTVSQLAFGNPGTDELVSQIITDEMVNSLKPFPIFLAIIIFVEGFLLYGLLAGLAGAAVSRLENITEGMKLYTMVLLVGAYASMFAAMGGKRYTFLYLFPITAPFSTTSYLLTGEVGIAIALLSVVILTVCIAVLFRFVSAVYESMIFYSGNTLTLKQIIHFAVGNHAGKEKTDNEI